MHVGARLIDAPVKILTDALSGIAANATACGACEMMRRIATDALVEYVEATSGAAKSAETASLPASADRPRSSY